MLDDKGKINKIINAIAKASTPPSLFGIDRRIAYTHKKYHSGLICTGVTNGFAIKKFSGSVNRFGIYITTNKNIVDADKYPTTSFDE